MSFEELVVKAVGLVALAIFYGLIAYVAFLFILPLI